MSLYNEEDEIAEKDQGQRSQEEESSRGERAQSASGCFFKKRELHQSHIGKGGPTRQDGGHKVKCGKNITGIENTVLQGKVEGSEQIGVHDSKNGGLRDVDSKEKGQADGKNEKAFYCGCLKLIAHLDVAHS